MRNGKEWEIFSDGESGRNAKYFEKWELEIFWRGGKSWEVVVKSGKCWEGMGKWDLPMKRKAFKFESVHMHLSF